MNIKRGLGALENNCPYLDLLPGRRWASAAAAAAAAAVSACDTRTVQISKKEGRGKMGRGLPT